MISTSPVSFKGRARHYLKKAWKALPVVMRELPLKCLCMLFLGNHQPVRPMADVPVYIIGNFQAGGGISRSAQLYAKQIREKNRHCICVDTTQEMLQTVKNPISDGSVRRLVDIRDDAGSGTVIIHLNPPQFLWLLCQLRRKFFQHKHVVAYWAWELEDIPALWKFALRFVDAVEVPSTFTQVAVARNTDKPVTIRPHVVPTPRALKQEFAHDGKLRCLCVFDMASLCSRKNPQAAIVAFLHAFAPEEAELTIKISQADVNATDWKCLQALAAPHAHIRLIAEWMDAATLERLFLEHDVYLSLHRSEGYGLSIREAMLYNLYVVATGWSGNMDFMQGERIFPIPYTLVPVNKADRTFGCVANPRWAEADLQATTDILRGIRQSLMNTIFQAKITVNYKYTPDPDVAFSACPAPRLPRWGTGAMPDNAKMVIVHYIPTLGPGGAERQCVYAAASQVSQGHDVWILTHHLETEFDSHYLSLALAQGAKHAVLPHWELARGLIDNLSQEDVEALFRSIPPEGPRYDTLSLMLFLGQLQPDILHNWMYPPNIQGTWGGLLTGVPRIIMNVRSVSQRHFPHAPPASWLWEQIYLLARHERVNLLFNSKAGAADYANWLGFPVSEMHVIHNGTDTDIKVTPAYEIREKLSIPADAPVLLGIFRLSPEKRPLLFLETAGLLRRRLPALRVFVAGEGQMREEMERGITNNGLEKCVTLLGRRDDIPDLLCAADAMLLASDREGFPNVLQEAQVYGCPVVCTDAGDAAEIVENGVTGIVCPIDTDAATLCEYLAHLITDKAASQKMAEAGVRRIKKLYSLKILGNALCAHYHQLFAFDATNEKYRHTMWSKLP